MTKKYLLTVASFIAILIFSDCKINPFHDLEPIGQDAEWAIPLVDTKKSFSEIIKDFDKQAFLQIAADGGLTLHYTGNYITKSSLDIFAQFQNILFPILDTAMVLPFSAPNGVDIDFVDIKKGTLIWAMVSPDEVLEVTLKIPQLSKNGQTFTKKFNISRIVSTDSLDLNGWRLDATSSDSIIIIHDARRANGTRVNLKNSGLFSIRDFEIKFAKGYFGKEVFDAPADIINIDFFDNWKRGEVRFEDPRMTVTLDNSFGIPVRSVTKVADVISVNGSRLALKSPLTEGVDINYPKLTEIGQTKRTVVVLDKNNSNIKDVISANPVSIEYDIDGLTNPDPTQRAVGFMTDSSAFKLQVELDLPLHVSATTFEVTDTFDVNFNKDSELKTAEIKILSDNGMPIDLILQGYFLNNNQILDSLFTSNATFILKGAPVNSIGLPTGIQTQQTLVKVDSSKLQRIHNANKLVVKYAFSTTGNGVMPVKLMAAQQVRLRMGVKFNVN
jgi:hypothetical protein